MSHIFISYSKQNKDYARKLADHLLGQGFNVWIDDQIEPSDEWWKTVVKAIRECAAFLVIMTPQSGTSRWVEREVMLADELQKPMFPVLLDGDLHASELWALFFGKQYEDAHGGKLPAERFSAKLERSAPRKAGGGADVTAKPAINLRDWTPDFDTYERDSEVSEQVVADFVRRHSARLQKLREQQILSPPDLSHILPPPFDWCEIPAGKVTIEYNETDHKTFDVPQFWMAKYPITNAQYQVFVDAVDGYRNAEWWAYAEAAQIWRRVNQQPQKTAFEGDELSRTNVTWYEAVAYCQWLSGQLPARIPNPGESLVQALNARSDLITLPSEQQWQRAAQGEDHRPYPWGQGFDANRCNTYESGIGKPTSVTRYKEGASAYGVWDMSGNTWEWCLNQHGTTNVLLNGQFFRVLRGGSFGLLQGFARTKYIGWNEPHHRDQYVGFRVMAMRG